MWVCLCLTNFPSCKWLFSIGRNYKDSPSEWARLCTTTFPELPSNLLHWLQLQCFSPVWGRLWRTKFPELQNDFCISCNYNVTHQCEFVCGQPTYQSCKTVSWIGRNYRVSHQCVFVCEFLLGQVKNYISFPSPPAFFLPVRSFFLLFIISFYVWRSFSKISKSLVKNPILL